MVYDKGGGLRKIFDTKTGCCHFCNKKLNFNNYRKKGVKGAWKIDETNPSNTLYAVCMSCNHSNEVPIEDRIKVLKEINQKNETPEQAKQRFSDFNKKTI